MNLLLTFGNLILNQKRDNIWNAYCVKQVILKKGTVTVTLEKNGSIVLIKNVPAEVCTNCGHYYLSEDMAETVLKKGQDAINSGAKLEVLKLQEA